MSVLLAVICFTVQAGLTWRLGGPEFFNALGLIWLAVATVEHHHD